MPITPEELGLELLNNTPIGPITDLENDVLLRIRSDYIAYRLNVGMTVTTKLFDIEVEIVPIIHPPEAPQSGETPPDTGNSGEGGTRVPRKPIIPEGSLEAEELEPTH